MTASTASINSLGARDAVVTEVIGSGKNSAALRTVYKYVFGYGIFVVGACHLQAFALQLGKKT